MIIEEHTHDKHGGFKALEPGSLFEVSVRQSFWSRGFNYQISSAVKVHWVSALPFVVTIYWTSP
jgi:hypothetical protein